ncbi:hypothetical protein AVEN_99954-1, partial [Araneus ventricosus]
MENPKCINCGKLGHVASWRGCEKFPKPRPPATNRQPPTTFAHRTTDNRTFAQTLAQNNQQQSIPPQPFNFPALQQMVPLLQTPSTQSDELTIPEILELLKTLNDLRVALTQNPSLLAILRNIKLCKTPNEMIEKLLTTT